MSAERPCVLERLEVSEVKDGLIVFDPVTDVVHHLNASAAVVFALCDGERDLTGIAAVMAEAYGLDDPPLAEVRACVRSFSEQRLLA
ncbi:MAG: PqqD family protein [Acidimicrobiales bacterium]